MDPLYFLKLPALFPFGRHEETSSPHEVSPSQKEEEPFIQTSSYRSPIQMMEDETKKSSQPSSSPLVGEKELENSALFPSFMNWVTNLFYSKVDDNSIEDWSNVSKEKMRQFFSEVDKALTALDQIRSTDEEDYLSFQEMLFEIHQGRRLEQKRVAESQAESLIRARKELAEKRDAVSSKHDDILKSLGRRGFFNKLQEILGPISGMINSFGLPPGWDLAVLSLSVILMGDVLTDHAAPAWIADKLTEKEAAERWMHWVKPMSAVLATALVIPYGGVGPLSAVMLVSRSVASLGEATISYSSRCSQADLLVLQKTSRDAWTKLNNLASKGAVSFNDYLKDYRTLSSMLQSQQQLVQYILSR